MHVSLKLNYKFRICTLCRSKPVAKFTCSLCFPFILKHTHTPEPTIYRINPNKRPLHFKRDGVIRAKSKLTAAKYH